MDKKKLLRAYDLSRNVAEDVFDPEEARELRDILHQMVLDEMAGSGTITFGGYIPKPNGIQVNPVVTPTDWGCTPKVTCSGLDPAYGYTTV